MLTFQTIVNRTLKGEPPSIISRVITMSENCETYFHDIREKFYKFYLKVVLAVQSMNAEYFLIWKTTIAITITMLC